MTDNLNINNGFEGDYEQEDQLDDVYPITEYNISVSPNDFNIKTIFDFIDSKIIKIPGFQRNYVWDIKRASKLIESLLIGIPIPQIFLYEEKKNSFLVIDGQQRLMTIYYFIKKRFPRNDKRVELRKIFDNEGTIPENILSDNSFFFDFNLNIPEQLPNNPNKFNKKNYSTLDECDKISFELKTIRNIIIKSNSLEKDDDVVFEIFNRLNTGGVNLKPQEIRTSLYHSKFYEMLYDINLNDDWRNLLPNPTPNINMKEVEILLRGFAMLIDKDNYRPSMTKFLNAFSNKAKKFDDKEVALLKNIFEQFVRGISSLNDNKIFWTVNNRFNISIYEAVFTTLCKQAYTAKDDTKVSVVELGKINQLKEDSDFIKASSKSTANKDNVNKRNTIAKQILLGNDNG
ncbi:GmrSD restriction endonuclease domain-containing protein [Capnocytophaga canimorsus]|uniref:GmrSD restriction endonuclease domain-containing protein n=1 Tax=Capnocytophaga canimorsus TaxID=28188 RepID=UPI001AD56C41|nr:DUF262 domain-containing protein [Capnocytophaga canimorsus]GIM59918.1 hypothetical protein CAPN007_21270 [Capnocytophaga canimorsus]